MRRTRVESSVGSKPRPLLWEREGHGIRVQELCPVVVASAARIGISPRCEVEATVASGLTILVARQTASVSAAPKVNATAQGNLSDIVAERAALICITPRRAVSPEFAFLLKNTHISRVLVDQSTVRLEPWRQSPRQRAFLSLLAERLQGVYPSVLSAVTDSAVCLRALGMDGVPDAVVHVSDVGRRNLKLAVEPRGALPLAQLVSWLYARRGKAGVIYCLDHREVAAISDTLHRLGFSVILPNHRAFGTTQRRAVFEPHPDNAYVALVPSGGNRWLKNANLRFVLHTHTPRSLEDYLTEIEVANGTDPPPECVILCGSDDLAARKDRQSHQTDHSARKRRGIDSINAYCATAGCRHLEIIKYLKPAFRPPSRLQFSCYKCDNCLSEPRACYGDDTGPL